MKGVLAMQVIWFYKSSESNEVAYIECATVPLAQAEWDLLRSKGVNLISARP